MSEATLPAALREAFAISEELTHDQPDRGYVVLPRKSVPPEAWESQELIVERYIENKEFLFYRAFFLCNRFAIAEGRERAFVKTLRWPERLLLFCTDAAGEACTAIPGDLQPAVYAILRFAKMTGMEFGGLDVLRNDDDEFYIIDMNSTPAPGLLLSMWENKLHVIEHLAIQGRQQ